MLRAYPSRLLAAILLISPVEAQEKKPPLPPGRDPGGQAVALISTGIDYTRLDIAARLARDGEGADRLGLRRQRQPAA
jgi:hypothetical protein